jgi:hypothetical protein
MWSTCSSVMPLRVMMITLVSRRRQQKRRPVVT